jgi:lysozyme family protein
MDTKINELIDAIIKAEGGDTFTNDPKDGGGRTQYGIAEASNPEAWADGKVTLEEAKDIYFKKYVEGPGFSKVKDQRLQHQLVDFGVNSGPSVSIRCLQEVLGVDADGKLGNKTLEALDRVDNRAINNELAKKRALTLAKICVKNPTQLRFLVGWLNRALEFMV